MAHEVGAEPASRNRDPAVGGQLDEVVDLAVVEVVRPDELELDRSRSHTLLEVLGAEAVPVPEELEAEIVARRVVRLTCHWSQASLRPMTRNRFLVPGVVAAVIVIWVVGAAITRFSFEQMAYLAPVAVVVVGLTIGVVLVWVKIVSQALRDRREASS